MLKNFTCIICPNGCEIQADVDGGKILSISGNKCEKGVDYVKSEAINPMRNFATSIPVSGGELPLCSVRLTKPIPRECIFSAISEIKKHKLTAPVKPGQTVIKNLLGLDTDVITTKEIEKLQ